MGRGKKLENKKAALKSLNKGSLGKQEQNHPVILDAELETGFGESISLNKLF